jgi:hypothetical protein
MKKLAILIVLIFTGFNMYSQNGTYGVRGGATLSRLNFDNDSDLDLDTGSRVSFYIGFFADFQLSNTVSVVPELQFSPEGSKEELLHLNLIQLPVFFKFKVHERVRLGVGPQVAINTNRINDAVQDFHFSGIPGVEYKLNQMLFIDLRYSAGINNVFENDIIEATNSNFQLGIGYQF